MQKGVLLTKWNIKTGKHQSGLCNTYTLKESQNSAADFESAKMRVVYVNVSPCSLGSLFSHTKYSWCYLSHCKMYCYIFFYMIIVDFIAYFQTFETLVN